MSRMYRLNHDGTVELCDDTPDEVPSGVKYQRSTMRDGAWIRITSGGYIRRYIPEHEVPNIIKLAVLLES